MSSPFSFLSVRSRTEGRLAEYVIREHQRGRSLQEILADPWVRNRWTHEELVRLLERPDVVHAIGTDDVEAVRAALRVQLEL